MADKTEIPDEIKETYTEDGLRLMLKYYRNMGRLSVVSKKTGISVETLKRFTDGKDCLTAEQDKILRAPLKEYGSKQVKVSVNLKKVSKDAKDGAD